VPKGIRPVIIVTMGDDDAGGMQQCVIHGSRAHVSNINTNLVLTLLIAPLLIRARMFFRPKIQLAHSRSADAELRGSDIFSKNVLKSTNCTFGLKNGLRVFNR